MGRYQVRVDRVDYAEEKGPSDLGGHRGQREGDRHQHHHSEQVSPDNPHGQSKLSDNHGNFAARNHPRAHPQRLGRPESKRAQTASAHLPGDGTVSLNGLPPGNFPLDIFGMVLNGITVRGSIVGTRLDLQESLQFAAEGKVAATVSTDRLENINDVFARMHAGTIEGRVVLDFAA